nr:uncharacterized protein LOC117224710 [Megalopta genalis]
MVRKSILVYDLLRTEQPPQGFSEREIIEQISGRHDITVGKGLRRQVAVALRRGLDFGILAKKNNRFRFDPDNANVTSAKRKVTTRKSRSKKKKNGKKKRTTKTSRRSSSVRNKNRKQGKSVPQPMLPKSWLPNRRNIMHEPLPRVKKI